MNKNLASKTANGVKWSSVSTIVRAVIQIGYTSIMGHLLDAETFGLYALMHVVLRFVDYFAKMGMGQAIIQKLELERQDIRIAFTVSTVLGLVSALIVWSFSSLSYLISENPSLPEIVRFASITFIFQGLFTTSISLLSRDLRFKNIAINEIVSFVLGYVFIGITMAFFGFGVYSLICASISQILINGFLSFIVIKHPIKPLFIWKRFKPFLSYGGRVSINSFFEFINISIDKILIEKFLGTRLLGFYDRASQLVYLPLYYITTSVAKVMMPSFSRLQDNIKELSKVYLKIISLVIIVLFPFSSYLIFSAEEIVLVVLGEGWEPSITVLRILAIAIPLSMINMFAGIVCDATAHLNIKMVLIIMRILFICVMFYILMDLGLIGFAWAVVVSDFFYTIAYMFLMNKILKLELIKTLKSYSFGIINAIVVGLTLLFIDFILGSFQFEYEYIVSFFIKGALGFPLILLLILFVHPPLISGQLLTLINKINLDANSEENFYTKSFKNYKHYLVKRNNIFLQDND
ncbi:lipopolysaccharide biosynthesis protein [Flexithrix dorotheae]|uniref:lipopolysaccharide biosynthesis protein n=1 Tax=Flexithrix dorotheae TaxID=70993 RepID=UPI000361BFB4|nr:lipopolysaccharide biosynthesis protein [Flexithrix dorotheae]